MYTLEQCRGTTDQGFLNKKKKNYHTPLKGGFFFFFLDEYDFNPVQSTNC